LGRTEKNIFWLFPSWEERKKIFFGFSQVGKIGKKHFLAFPKLGRSEKNIFWLFPSWEGILLIYFGSSQVGKGFYTHFLAFPKLGNTKGAAPLDLPKLGRIFIHIF
jgi:hypothetical protein